MLAICMNKYGIAQNTQGQSEKSIYEMKADFDAAHPEILNNEQEEEGEATKFNRWFQYWDSRLAPDGFFSNYQKGMQLLVDQSQSNTNNISNGCGLYDLTNSENNSYDNDCGIKVSDWQSIGPTSAANDVATGRYNVIRLVHNSNNQILYAGSANGGLYKTTDGGTNWHEVKGADKIPFEAISDIAINPTDPNKIIVAATSYFVPADAITHIGTMSQNRGLFFSNDGGVTWNKRVCNLPNPDPNNPIPFTFSASNPTYYWSGFNGSQGNCNRIIKRIVINPSSPNILYLAVRSIDAFTSKNLWGGLYYSDDYGDTWQLKISGMMNDIEILPSNNNIVYAAGLQLYRSTNGGVNFTQILNTVDVGFYGNTVPNGDNISQNGVLLLSASPLHSNTMFVFANSPSMTNPLLINISEPTLTTTQKNYFFGDPPSIYCSVFERSPFNSSRTYIGSVNFRELTDGLANTYTSQNLSVGHADNNNIEFAEGSDDFWVANDFGIYFYNGTNFTSQKVHASLLQIYSFDITQTSNPSILIGTQDNWSWFKVNGNNWNVGEGGDAHQMNFDDDNSPTGYYFTDNQAAINFLDQYISFNNGVSLNAYGHIFSSTGIAGIQTYRPVNREADGFIYHGYRSLWRQPLKNTLTANLVNIVDFSGVATLYQGVGSFKRAVNSHNWVYVGIVSNDRTGGFQDNTSLLNNYLYRVDLAGTTFPVPNASITDISFLKGGANHQVSTIEVDPNNDSNLWVGYNGFVDYTNTLTKVIHSTDAGNTWHEISAGLPPLPIKKLKYDQVAQYLYAATDIGMYYCDATDADNAVYWKPYNQNLPIVEVTDIEIHNLSRQLYISTFSRGLWKSKLIERYTINAPLTAIGTNTVWNSNMIIKGKIIVPANITLTIQNCTVKFNPADPESGITVQKGGKLIIDNATLTSSCSYNLWAGIQAHGNPTGKISMYTGQLNQHPNLTNIVWDINNNLLPNATIQAASIPDFGLVVCKSGAVIENAHQGIVNCAYTVKPWAEDVSKAGGIVAIEGATFNNNWKSIMIHGTKNWPHQDKIINSTFVQTQAKLNNGQDFDKMIAAWGVRNIDIDGCTFENKVIAATNTKDYKGQAIVAADAGIRIANCTFANLDRGIRVLASPAFAAPVKISGNTFTNVWRGVLLKGLSANNVTTLNTFDIAPPTTAWQAFNSNPWNQPEAGEISISDNAYGLYVENCDYFDIQENNFNTSVTDWSNLTQMIGSYAWGSSPTSINTTHDANITQNQIRRNTYSTPLMMGAQNSFVNNYLEYRCNDFTTLDWYAIQVGSSGKIGDDQGYCSYASSTPILDPAGNQFKPCAIPNSLGITDMNVADGGNPLTYHHHTPVGLEPFCYNTSVQLFDCQIGFNPVTDCPQKAFTSGGWQKHLPMVEPADLQAELESLAAQLIHLQAAANNADAAADKVAIYKQYDYIAGKHFRTLADVLYFYTANNDYTTAEQLLLEQNTTWAKLEYVKVLLAQNKLSQATEALSTIADEKVSDNKSLLQLAIIAQADSLSWQSLNEEQKEAINRIATKNTNAGKQAQAIQYLIDGKDYAEHFEMGVFEGLGERKAKTENNKTTLAFNSNFNIYPNPTTGQLTIDTKCLNYNIEITNSLGQIVLKQLSLKTKAQIELKGLLNGIYFIKIHCQNTETYFSKFILNK
jgi:hypothetical protein